MSGPVLLSAVRAAQRGAARPVTPGPVLVCAAVRPIPMARPD